MGKKDEEVTLTPGSKNYFPENKKKKKKKRNVSKKDHKITNIQRYIISSLRSVLDHVEKLLIENVKTREIIKRFMKSQKESNTSAEETMTVIDSKIDIINSRLEEIERYIIDADLFNTDMDDDFDDELEKMLDHGILFDDNDNELVD